MVADPEFETSFKLGDWKVVNVKWQRFHKNIQIGAFSNNSSSIVCVSADYGNMHVAFRALHGCNWQGDFCIDKDSINDVKVRNVTCSALDYHNLLDK